MQSILYEATTLDTHINSQIGNKPFNGSSKSIGREYVYSFIMNFKTPSYSQLKGPVDKFISKRYKDSSYILITRQYRYRLSIAAARGSFHVQADTRACVATST